MVPRMGAARLCTVNIAQPLYKVSLADPPIANSPHESLNSSAMKMANQSTFTGFNWHGLLKFPEGTYYHQQGQPFFNSIDWDANCQYASELHNGEFCALDPQITMGCNQLIRILNFADGSRWIARPRILFTKTGVETKLQCRYIQREVDCIQLVKERSNVPVLALFSYIASADNHIGAPIMFQECLSGNCAMNLNTLREVPTQHKSIFLCGHVKVLDKLTSAPAC